MDSFFGARSFQESLILWKEVLKTHIHRQYLYLWNDSLTLRLLNIIIVCASPGEWLHVALEGPRRNRNDHSFASELQAWVLPIVINEFKYLLFGSIISSTVFLWFHKDIWTSVCILLWSHKTIGNNLICVFRLDTCKPISRNQLNSI